MNAKHDIMAWISGKTANEGKQVTRRGNGFGSLICKGDGKPWLARWVYKGQVYYKSTGEAVKSKALKALERITRPYRDAREEDAIRNLQNRLIELQENRSKSQLKLEDVWDEFARRLKKDDVEDGTTQIYENATNRMIAWMATKVKYAKDITPRIAEEYLEQLASEVGANTYNIRLVLFKRIWRYIREDFQLCNDAWEKFKKKKAAKSSRRTLSAKEIANLLLAAKTYDLRLLLTIGMYTGLRISDCAMLKWNDVDLEKKILRVVPIKTRKHMEAPLEIPMHPTLLRMLGSAPHMGEYVSRSNADSYASGLLSGQVIAIFRKCGIETSRIVNGKLKLICGFHSLRHTFVSMAINAGMSPLLVQKIVGHSAVNMTEHYFHDNAEKAAEGISALPDIGKMTR